MSTRRTSSGHRASTSSHRPSVSHAAVRPRSTASPPTSFFSALTNPESRTKRNSTSSGKARGVSFSDERDRGFGSSSAYKRSPRPNFIARTWEKINRLIRQFIRYARKNPLKVVVPLVLALMGGGALAGLVKRMGGLQALGLGGLTSIGVDKWIGAGKGLQTGYQGYMGNNGGRRRESEFRSESYSQQGQSGGFDGLSMAKGAIKVASAFL